MRVRHLLILLLALPLAGCGGCRCSSDPRDAAPNPKEPGETKPPVELTVRLRAATTLPKRGELPPELLAALQDDSPHVRRAAIFTVQHSGADAKTISAALTPLLKDHDQFLRVVVAEVLWEVEQNPDALAVMKKIVRDGTDRRAATRAIGALGDVGPAAKDIAPELTALLKNADPALRVLIADALARIRFADVPALAEALADAQLKDLQGGSERTAPALARVFAAMGKDAVPPLVQLMKSGDARKQKCAVLAIAEVPRIGPEAVPALAALLRVRQYETHLTALEVLAHLGPDAEPALLNLLDLFDDEDPLTAREAAVAVGNIGRPALQPLLIRLRSKKPHNEAETIALARIGKDAVPPLLDALKSDDPTIRRRAALALGGMEAPPKEALPAVIALLKEWTENPEGDAYSAAGGVSGVAARRRHSTTVRRLVTALPHFRHEAADAVPLLIPLLRERSPALRIAAAQALGALGAAARPAIPALRELTADKESASEVTGAAGAALLALPLDRKEDLPVLVELLKNVGLPNEVRAAAVEQIARLGPEAADAVPDLLEIVADRKGEAATEYLPNAIGRMGEGALPKVVAVVRAKKEGWQRQCATLLHFGPSGRAVALRWLTDEDDELRAQAAWLLGAMGPSPEAAVPLLDALNDLSAIVRWNAAAALYFTNVDATAAVPALTKRLLDPNPLVRQTAAWELLRYRPASRAAVPALIDALKDDDEHVRVAAMNALRHIGVERQHVGGLVTILEGKGSGAREVLQLLPDLSDDAKEAVPALRELRKDERWQEPVLVALWHVAGDGSAGTRLLDRLRQPDRNARAEAVYALGGKGGNAVLLLAALTDALRDPEPSVRQAACRTLARVGADDHAALRELVALIKQDRNEAVILEAQDALVAMKSAAKEAVPALKEIRKKASPSDQADWNAILWQISNDDEAFAALTALLADRDACAAAARALAEIGPPAKSAVPALRAQRDNPKRTLRELAAIERALRQIDAK